MILIRTPDENKQESAGNELDAEGELPLHVVVWVLRPAGDGVVGPESEGEGDDDHEVVRRGQAAADRFGRVFGEVLRRQHRRGADGDAAQQPPRVEHAQVRHLLHRAPDQEEPRKDGDGYLAPQEI